MAILKYNARIYEDTAANLATDETIYKSNELICETDTGVMKRGNGVDVYADLTAIGSGSGGGSVAWGDITGIPAATTSAPGIVQLGATSAEASAGNHNHAVIAHSASGLAAAANIQALAQALSTRIKALEDAGA